MPTQVAIVGGGVVGASLALALKGSTIALVAGRRPPAARGETEPSDPRVYALSPGSVAFLQSIGVWQSIPPARLTPVYAMQVYGDHPSARLGFDAYRAGVAELAWIVEDRELQAALWKGLDDQDDLEIIVPARCESLELHESAALTLAGGRRLEVELVVGADGADSIVRSAGDIQVFSATYGQTAVVANFACERPHRNVAMQWFQGGPVLALLPLPENRVSMVRSLPDDDAARVMALDPCELAEEVGAASHGALGSLRAATSAQAFPLRRLTSQRLVARRLALVGDAAHVIHPLAGQGLNLGLQDACALGAVLAGREPVRDCGDLNLLRRYERERAEAILAMRTAVHGLHSLFGAGSETVRRMRNLGLNLTDRLPVLKNDLLRHALR